MDDGSINDLMLGIRELDEARPGYAKAEAYYDGNVPEVFASSRVRRALAANDIDFRLNFAKTPVTAVVKRLKITAVTSPDDAQSEALAAVWRDNQLALEAPDLHSKTCMYGDGYLIVLPIEDDKNTVTGVEMYFNSPLTVRAIYREDRPREVDFYIKRWTERGCTRAELLYDNRVERWTTKKDSKGSDPSDWEPWLLAPEGDDDPDPNSWLIAHSWKWPQHPVFHFRNARPYGRPEHADAYGAQNAVTKLTTTHMGNVDFQGAPQRYALTEAANTDTSDLDPGDWPDDDFPAQPGGPTDSGDDSALKADPGGMWLLRGFKNVGQFDAADPKTFLDPADWYVRAMAHVSDTPSHHFDISGDDPSGESRRRKDAPLVDKVEDRQKLLGATWEDAHVFALRLLGFEDPVVDVRWKPAAMVEDQEGWKTVTEKVANGVPRKQALMETGYRQEQVDEWLDGVDDAELQRRVDILASLADSAQKLGAATALGVVDSAQVQALLNGALSEVELLADVQEAT
ncbi:phage portal protein [Streptomyces sp. NPDC005892]|uniref:phage portal protein n=1 Tax=Streptomyces sp. NPDC005892 TaxID=3155593 RepID=UPI0033F4C2D9